MLYINSQLLLHSKYKLSRDLVPNQKKLRLYLLVIYLRYSEREVIQFSRFLFQAIEQFTLECLLSAIAFCSTPGRKKDRYMGALRKDQQCFFNQVFFICQVLFWFLGKQKLQTKTAEVDQWRHQASQVTYATLEVHTQSRCQHTRE